MKTSTVNLPAPVDGPVNKHWRSASSLAAPETTPLRKKTKSCFPDNPTATDYLEIRSGNKPNYKRRYFCLKNNFLLSARNPKARKLERVIPLEGTNVSSETKTSLLSFEIITNKKVYYFKCKSENQCRRWTRAIQKASKMELRDIYKIGRTLGISETQSTKVVEAKHRITNNRVAIKIIDKKRCDPQDLQNEVQVLKRIKHECVVQLYDIFETAQYLHLVMELCEGGELFEKLVSIGGGDGPKYTEDQCCKIIHQIARGVKYMHSHGIVHRDLKPENILCKDHTVTQIKVADFGISKVLQGQQTHMKTICGTLSYLAPEVLKGLPYDHTVDYWSIGVIMHLLLSGNPPFEGRGDSQLAQSILSDQPNLDTKDWDHVSKQAKDLVKQLLCKDPKGRGNLDDVLKVTWGQKTTCPSFGLAIKKLRQFVAKGKIRRMSVDAALSGDRFAQTQRAIQGFPNFGARSQLHALGTPNIPPKIDLTGLDDRKENDRKPATDPTHGPLGKGATPAGVHKPRGAPKNLLNSARRAHPPHERPQPSPSPIPPPHDANAEMLLDARHTQTGSRPTPKVDTEKLLAERYPDYPGPNYRPFEGSVESGPPKKTQKSRTPPSRQGSPRHYGSHRHTGSHTTEELPDRRYQPIDWTAQRHPGYQQGRPQAYQPQMHPAPHQANPLYRNLAPPARGLAPAPSPHLAEAKPAPDPATLVPRPLPQAAKRKIRALKVDIPASVNYGTDRRHPPQGNFSRRAVRTPVTGEEQVAPRVDPKNARMPREKKRGGVRRVMEKQRLGRQARDAS